MSRWGGRSMAVAAVLVAGLLVETEAAYAAPVSTTSAPARSAAPATVVAAPVIPSPAAAARAAFGATGSLVVLVEPLVRPAAPGVTADAVARGTVGTSSAGDVDAPVLTASLVKLYLAEGVLSQARGAGVALPADDLQRIDAMLTSSDDQAASDLWVTYDGPAVLAEVVSRYGLRGTAAPAPDPGAWGQTSTTAADLARFLVDLPATAHPEDAARILGLLARATPVGADGFDQSFGLLAPGLAGGVAAKQGWMCCVDGQRYLHSVGVQDDRVVVLLAAFPADVDWPTARAAVDAAAAALAG